MLDCMELPVGKIQEIDKLSVYQYNKLYTSTVGFDLSVSLLCDGRLQWSSSHLSPFFYLDKHSKESLTVTGGGGLQSVAPSLSVIFAITRI